MMIEVAIFKSDVLNDAVTGLGIMAGTRYQPNIEV